MIKELLDRIIALEKRIEILEGDGRSEVASSAPRRAFADLPAAAATGRFYVVTNGRQAGEGAGLGTGVLAVDHNVAGVPTWVRADDNPVAVTV